MRIKVRDVPRVNSRNKFSKRPVWTKTLGKCFRIIQRYGLLGDRSKIARTHCTVLTIFSLINICIYMYIGTLAFSRFTSARVASRAGTKDREVFVFSQSITLFSSFAFLASLHAIPRTTQDWTTRNSGTSGDRRQGPASIFDWSAHRTREGLLEITGS